MDEFLTVQQTANFLHCSTSRLAKLRCLGEGVKFTRDGGRILYSKKEIMEYLESRTHQSTDEYLTTPGTGRPKASE